jgi:hypothetical protein
MFDPLQEKTKGKENTKLLDHFCIKYIKMSRQFLLQSPDIQKNPPIDFKGQAPSAY